MPKSDPAAVREYIANQPKPVQAALKRIRATIHKAVPNGEDAISYKIPAFRVHGRIALFYAGWTEHYSVYPAGSQAVIAKFKKELARYDVRKGTIRFSLDEPVPVRLIERIAKFRAKELGAQSKTRS